MALSDVRKKINATLKGGWNMLKEWRKRDSPVVCCTTVKKELVGREDPSLRWTDDVEEPIRRTEVRKCEIKMSAEETLRRHKDRSANKRTKWLRFKKL